MGFDVREFIRRVAVEAFDATATEEPIDGFGVRSRRGLDDPLSGVRAAMLVHQVAAGQVRRWALAARGAGRSWDDVAAALDLPRTDDTDTARSAGEVAWGWLVEHRPPNPPGGRASGRCRRCGCASCRFRVRDIGPFASNPGDRETGHAPGCARHGAEVAAWHRHHATDHDCERDTDHDPDDDRED